MKNVINISFYDWLSKLLATRYSLNADSVLRNRLDSSHRNMELRSVIYRILYDEFMMTAYDIGKVFGVSHATVHKALHAIQISEYSMVQRDMYYYITKNIMKGAGFAYER